MYHDIKVIHRVDFIFHQVMVVPPILDFTNNLE